MDMRTEVAYFATRRSSLRELSFQQDCGPPHIILHESEIMVVAQSPTTQHALEALPMHNGQCHLPVCMATQTGETSCVLLLSGTTC
jgi:hypothetical protein